MSKRRQRPPQTPVATQVIGLSHEGRGIAKIAGKTIFIDDALPGESVTFSYTKQFSQYDEASLMSVEVPAPERVTPICQHFGVCGGCRLQHMSAQTQLSLKQNTLLDLLTHVGKTAPQTLLPALTGPTTHYRHKARLSVKYVEKKGGLLIGFRERDGRFVNAMTECHILTKIFIDCLPKLHQTITALSICKAIPQIELAAGDSDHAIILRHLQPLTAEDALLLTQFSRQQHIAIYLQSGGVDSITRLTPEDGEDRLYYQHPDYALRLGFHPSDFTQVNLAINRQMVPLAIELLCVEPTDVVLDLFCGLGNFSLPLARVAKHVYGVEGCEKMTARAAENARLNAIENVSFAAQDLTQTMPDATWRQVHPNKVLLDPPRSGAETVCHQLGTLKPQRIVYVSCNPATLARDTAILLSYGYRLEHAGIMDMFPHTAHVEAIACFVLS